MLVYRDGASAVDPLSLVRAIRAEAEAAARNGIDLDAATSLLIEVGLLECGLLDQAFPAADGLGPLVDRLGASASASGRLFHEAWRSGQGEADTALALVAALVQVERGPLPARVQLRTPEGFTQFGVYPEAFVAAAEAGLSGRAEPDIVVIGLRSIGTSLSAAVAAAVAAQGRETTRLTLRPRGAPFERRPVLSPELAGRLGERRSAVFLVVDEGPGLSGSSLTGTADLLMALGHPAAAILLLPSHLPEAPAFRSASASRLWPRLAKAQVPLEHLPQGPLPKGADLSGGAWRGTLMPDPGTWPAIVPAHERRKVAAIDAAGRPVLVKLAGLGRFGRMARDRGVALAEAGFGPEPAGLARGFLTWPLLGGRPGGAVDRDPALIATALRYLGFVGTRFAIGNAADTAPLLAMAEANVAAALGAAAAGTVRAAHANAEAGGAACAVALDARMLAHEWHLLGSRWLKLDATDHHDDPFYPGPADIAWDVAAFVLEHGLGDAAATQLVDALSALLRDPGLSRRLPFYRLAWPAFRFAYASLGAETVGLPAEVARLQASAERYRRLLRREIARAGS